MDSRNGSREKAKAWISDRRNKAILIGVIALVAIVLLQVGNQRPQRKMAPLFADCQLRNIDLQRMQIALSRAGLKEFELASDQILVPQQHTAQYLQALSDHDAVPAVLQDKKNSAAIANPFLTHSQQVSLERQARNQKLQEMLMLLPFVEQAWFEMDEAGARSSLQPVEKSAVVTIRPKQNQPLLEQQVYTISQLACGAINGLCRDRVVIVDLTTGFAHQGNLPNEEWEQKLQAQRVAYSRQQHLESRLRESLSRYDGLEISVLVEAADYFEPKDQTASLGTTAIVQSTPGEPTPDLAHDAELIIPQLKAPPLAPKLASNPATPAVTRADYFEETHLSGANGQVSLTELDETPLSSCSADHDQVASNERLNLSDGQVQLTSLTSIELVSPLMAAPERITVMVEVPERLLWQRFLRSSQLGHQPSRIEDSQRERNRTLQGHLEQLKPELDQTIRAVLAVQGLSTVPIVYHLISEPVAQAEASWLTAVQSALNQNWPSLAVLLTGLVLIGLITARGRETRPRHLSEAEEPVSTIRITSRNNLSEEECAAAKDQLSQMIEKDPEAAARVIENWIRDAA